MSQPAFHRKHQITGFRNTRLFYVFSLWLLRTRDYCKTRSKLSTEANHFYIAFPEFSRIFHVVQRFKEQVIVIDFYAFLFSSEDRPSGNFYTRFQVGENETSVVRTLIDSYSYSRYMQRNAISSCIFFQQFFITFVHCCIITGHLLGQVSSDFFAILVKGLGPV